MPDMVLNMSLRRDTLAAAMAVAADEPGRIYDLARVVVGNKRAFATNGKLVLTVSEGPVLPGYEGDHEGILTTADARAVVKAAGKRKDAAVFVTQGFVTTSVSKTSVATAKARDEVRMFPSAERIENTKPTKAVKHRVTLGVDVLSRLVTASKRVGVRYLSFDFRGKNEAFGIFGRNDDEDDRNYGARVEGHGMPCDMD